MVATRLIRIYFYWSSKLNLSYFTFLYVFLEW